VKVPRRPIILTRGLLGPGKGVEKVIDAIANGRPVVASGSPHAVELLDSGAGIIVDPDDTHALASALRTVIRQPRLAGTMAAEARSRAAELAWPVVAAAYLRLAEHLLAERRSRA
jgi:glycosyltransferase involved in cell wall biosynthesis